MQSDRKSVIIYTDGACEPNPGPGGYGVVLLHGEHRKELSGGFQHTTNNRMEIFAAIAGLRALKHPCQVALFSDSKYLVDAINLGWVKRWQQKHWMRTKNERAANVDLWEALLELCEQHDVTFTWIKGHAGVAENERCDRLSARALQAADLEEDTGYNPEAMTVVKMTYEGQPCRKCQTPVVKRPLQQKIKKKTEFVYTYSLFCPHCETDYYIEDAKRKVEKPITPTLFDIS